MKHNNLFLWLLGLTVCWLASCSEEDGRVKYQDYNSRLPIRLLLPILFISL